MSAAREVLLVGSVPLAPAAKVFETVVQHLGHLAPRIPDGEQIGWSTAAKRTFERHPDLEVTDRVPLNAGGRDPVDLFSLKPGRSAANLKLGPYGYRENAASSYAAFKRLRDQGVVPANTRYQVTLPGPGTSASNIRLPAEELLPLAREALAKELQGILAAIPASDLSVQIDLGMEAEHEEYLRRPDAWDQPLHKYFHWTQAQMAESVAWLANQIPPTVGLGFHICSIWHHDPSAGQDNHVLVATANAVTSRLKRPVDYFHLPVIPDHGESDYAAFRNLAVPRGTKIYLGLVNVVDGIEGAKRRIGMAEKVLSDFGVANYCGLGRPPTAAAKGQSSHSHSALPALRKATPETIAGILDFHRAAAML
jgi:hypothetical protein